MEIKLECSIEEITISGKKLFIIEGQEIILISSKNNIFAVSNICPHAKTKLISGRVEDNTLTCSNHGICFDLQSGEIRVDKIDEDILEQIDIDNLPFSTLKTYPIRIDNDSIYIKI